MPSLCQEFYRSPNLIGRDTYLHVTDEETEATGLMGNCTKSCNTLTVKPGTNAGLYNTKSNSSVTLPPYGVPGIVLWVCSYLPIATHLS